MAIKLTLRALADFERATGTKLLREGVQLGLDDLLHLAYYALRPGKTYDTWLAELEPEAFGAMLPELKQEVQDFFLRLLPAERVQSR